MKKLLLILCILLFPTVVQAANEWEAIIATTIAIQTLPSATPTPVTPAVVPGDAIPTAPAVQPETTPTQEPQKLYKVRPWPFRRYAESDNTSSVAENNIHSGDICNLPNN